MAKETSEALDLSGRLMRERVRARLVGARQEPVRIGRFELGRSRGHGGQGLVYDAFDTATRTHVALKCLHSVRGGEQAALQQEFRALSHLVHPNLVAMHELFCLDGAWFFTMELVDGVDIVQHVLASDDREQATRAAIAQLLRGLSTIHTAGFVHRDVKPGNVLVEASGRVVLVDFGLVVAQQLAEHARGGAGTPLYMAPEQREGRVPEPPADLYGVGAILFELLTATRFGELDTEPSEFLTPQQAAQARADYLLRVVDAADAAHDLHTLCRDLLAVDPAARPSAAEALVRLCAEPTEARVAGAPLSEPGSCFVAREAELAMLHASYEDLRKAGPRIVLVHGESGIGKSALLSRFARDLNERSSALVLRGRCYERESTPYKVFDGVIADLVRYLQGLAPATSEALIADLSAPLQQLFPAFSRRFGSRSIDESERAAELSRGVDARPRAFLALRELLLRLAQRTPIVMTIDDLQWADLDSLPLLEALCAPSARLPLLLVGNYRRDEVETSPFLSALLSPRALSPALCELVQLPLFPLSPSESEALVAELAPLSPSSPLIASARGVPFLLVEAALAPANDRVGLAQADVGTLFAARIAELDERARALLAVLAVAARPLPLALATQAVVGMESGFDTALELAARRLVRFRDLDGERCLEPYHDRVRQLVMAQVDEASARALHLAIDAAMVRLHYDEPLRRVEHLRAAGQGARAAKLAVRAAELSCAQLAWSQAADLFAAAIALQDDAPAALHEKLAEVLAFAARHAESAAAYMRAAAACAPARRSGLERLAAQQYVRAGHTYAGLALLDAALARVGVRVPRSQLSAALALLRGRLTVALAPLDRPLADDSVEPVVPSDRAERMATLQVFHHELWLSHPVQSALAHALYCREAMRAGPRMRIHALAAEVALLAVADGPKARAPIERLVARAEALTRDHGGAYEVAGLAFCRAVAAIHTEWRPSAAIAPLERADALLREHCAGTQCERAWIAMAIDHVLEITGQLRRLADGVRARELSSSGPDDNTRALRIVSVPLVLLLEDRPREALAMVNARLTTRREPLPLIDYIAMGRGVNALLYEGQATEAHDFFETERNKLGFQLVFRSSAVAADLSYLRARNAAAEYWVTREPRLRRDVERRVRGAQHLPPLARAHFRLIEASVARCDGRLADTRALLRAARLELDAAEGGLAAWFARYREAQLEGSTELLSIANAWFREQGVVRPENLVSLGIPGLDAWG